MRSGLCAVAAVLLAWLGAAGAASPQTACTKSDFEAVVDQAGAALRDLNQKNTPLFQAKLRQLKDKRSWSNDQFMKEAEPFVRDEAIAGFDKKSAELVERITGGGQAETAATAPDCALLDGLRADLKLLVETQKAKWTHMFGKIEKGLAK